jgi:hypothetical protein
MTFSPNFFLIFPLQKTFRFCFLVFARIAMIVRSVLGGFQAKPFLPGKPSWLGNSSLEAFLS